MRLNLIISLLLTLILVTVLVTFHFKSNKNSPPNSNQPSSENCHLRFGWGEWKPLQYLDDNGKLVGIHIDFTRAIAKQMGCEISFTFLETWNELLNNIRNGDIDFVGNATVTEDRSQFALFSIPYRHDVFAIYVLAENYDKFAAFDFESLKTSGFNLVLTENFVYGEALDDWRNDKRYNESLTYTKSPRDSYQLLLKQQVDGLVEDPFIVTYNLHKFNISKSLRALPFRTFGLPVNYMFSKKTVSPALIKRFNIALESVLLMPEYRSIWVNSKTEE